MASLKVSILLAGKAPNNQQQYEYKLVDLKNRWIVENYKYIISFNTLTFKGVSSNFSRVRNNSDEKISKEVALNCLEHIIMLYITVRTSIQQLHKIELKKEKANSLCKEIKKALSSLKKGH